MKAAIFDLDGTLLDSLGLWEKIDIEFLALRGFTVPKGYMDHISAISFQEAAEYTIKLFGFSESPDELIDLWNKMALDEYSHNICLKPGAKEYILFLKASGLKLAVATSLPAVLYEPVLRHNEIYDLFDSICSTDEVKKSKEFPDVFLLASEKLKVAPLDCTVFEDIYPAIRSAKKIGMKAVGVYDKYSEADTDAIKAIADRYLQGWPAQPAQYAYPAL